MKGNLSETFKEPQCDSDSEISQSTQIFCLGTQVTHNHKVQS